MAEKKLLVPNIGDFKNVEVIEVLVKSGQQIKKNDPLITLESDKSSVEVPATDEGKINKIIVKVGDKVSEGSEILSLDSVSKKEESKKEVAAKKILKKMGDKGRYDSSNQLKTLIVMQVLGNSKSFFDSQQQLNDIEGFFTDQFIPDAELTTNNIAQYFLFAGSDGLMNEMVMQQWQK